MKVKFTLFLCILSVCSFSQTIGIDVFASGFSQPVEITNAGDPRLFVVQQTGEIRILNPDGTIKPDNFLTLTNETILYGGERGLLGLAFHPQYATNGYFYVYYIRAGDGFSVVSRFSVDPANPDLALPGSEQVLLTIPQLYEIHKSGTLKFGPDGYLYIGSGDGGVNEAAQDINQNLGKILRIDVNTTNDALPYGIPAGNPYVGIDGNDEIWALGLRNPWKFSFDKSTGDLWIADVGQSNVEEINHVPSTAAGLNYGWICYEGDTVYTADCAAAAVTYTFPEASYLHSDGTCSITGGYVYTGTAFPTMLHKYFFADYCMNHIGMVDLTTHAITYSDLFEGANYFTTFGQDMNGELYIAASATGNIHRVIDTSLAVKQFDKMTFSMSPNPASSEFSIKIAHANYPATVNIIDVSGKVLLTQSLDAETNLIDSGSFQSGIYVVTVKDNNGAVSSSKLVLTK